MSSTFEERAQRIADLRSQTARLAQIADIPDMRAYADQWAALALEYDKLGALANAETCRANEARYKALAEREAGSWTRKHDAGLKTSVLTPNNESTK